MASSTCGNVRWENDSSDKVSSFLEFRCFQLLQIGCPSGKHAHLYLPGQLLYDLHDGLFRKYGSLKEGACHAAQISADEKAYVEECEKIHAAIKTALAGGTSFAEAAGRHGIKTSKTEPFNLSTQLTDENGQAIKSNALFHKQGDLCNLISTPDEFLLAYVAEKTAGDEAAALPGMRAELVNGLSGDKAARLVDAWRRKILKEAGFADLMSRPKESESTL